MGPDLKGIYNLYERNLLLYTPNSTERVSETVNISDISDPELDNQIGEEDAEMLREEVDLVESVYPEFDRDVYLKGDISPVFFGSAINTFGIQELLQCFLDIAPCPLPKESEERIVDPFEEKFTGFIFKIHANMDPKHRDRLAFVKIVSGKFKRNTNYKHIRLNRNLKFSSPTAFMAEKKSIVEEAFPGDIVGLHDTGNFKIGDTLTEGELIHYKGIPSFSPEMFRYVNNADPMKTKQLAKGVDQLMDEGVAQLFTMTTNGRKLIGTVGALQFEVIQYRLKHEYGASCTYENHNVHKACWISCDDKTQLAEFKKVKYRSMATDKYGRDVFLADSPFTIQMSEQKFPKVKFHFTSEFDD